MKIEIWSSGYLATGCEGIPVKATRLAIVEADNLDDAVRKHISKIESKSREYFSNNGGFWYHWGCRLFDNEADARRAFG